MSSSAASYGREKQAERSQFANKPPLQGDYLDEHIQAAAETMLDGGYVKPHGDIDGKDIKKFWARAFGLRDKLAKERGVSVPERKSKGGSTPSAPGNTELARLEVKISVLEARVAALEARASDDEIPF